MRTVLDDIGRLVRYAPGVLAAIALLWAAILHRLVRRISHRVNKHEEELAMMHHRQTHLVPEPGDDE